MPLPEEQVWRRRARDPLERDGNSLEGAPDPRARRNLTRGGDRPLSEAEPHSRRQPTHERGGFVPGRCRTPRAERSSARGWLGRLFDGSWVRGFVLRACLNSFVFIFYKFKRVSPDCLGDPRGCYRQLTIRSVCSPPSCRPRTMRVITHHYGLVWRS
jgi:hypothetical protein